MKNISFINQNKKFLRLFIISLIVVVVMGVLTNSKFFSIRNWNGMLSMIPELGILSLGIMLAMIVGGIDLSIVSIANLSGIIAAQTMLQIDNSFWGVVAGLVLGIAVGALSGALNGFLIAYIGVHPILVTLGTFQLFKGIAIVISKGYAIVNFSNGLTTFFNQSYLGLIPNIFIIFIIVGLLISFLLVRTIFGHSIYFVGENYKASVYSSLNSKKLLMQTFIIIGVLGAIAGIIMAGKTNSAKADYGASYILQSILICLLGGVNWEGGVGKTSGVILSVFTLQFLNSGFGLLRFSNFFNIFFTGLFLLLVMIYYYYIENYDLNKMKIKINKA